MTGPLTGKRFAASRTAAVLLAFQAFGWIAPIHASEIIGPAPLTSGPTPKVRDALREYDRFLDHHPSLEDQLRLSPRLAADPAFLGKNPELQAFLTANPEVTVGLQAYPHYYLNRALLRQASGPLPSADFAPLRDLFQQEPKLEQLLKGKPELIRNPLFLKTHPALHNVLTGNPALARVFLPPADHPPAIK